MIEQTKTCSVCKKEKSLSNFGKRKDSKDGKLSRCKSCESIRVKEWQANNQEYKKEYARVRRFTRHGISEELFKQILEKQNNLCAICKKPPFTEGTQPNIDHDHKCCPGQWSCGNCIRGILCNRCNSALGFLDDSIDNAMRLIEYLKTRSFSEMV